MAFGFPCLQHFKIWKQLQSIRDTDYAFIAHRPTVPPSLLAMYTVGNPEIRQLDQE
ncbi:hypothetical protein SAMN05192574_11898 [Mucilaginibacter gossypiicola]|uniref:Uncharacterized protein n=1 Tax=Mucilaginibacter gossypiicola TaxID=551995 RepID=A0A1H8U9J7_9SPHI|nr:hypothetical protein SAMN05192574_11898 [Mucilaginibacter gossypiicola]